MSLKEKIVSKFNSFVNFKLFLAVAVSVSLLMYTIIIFKPATAQWSPVPLFNIIFHTIFVPAIFFGFIGKFQKQIVMLVGGGSRTVQGRDGNIYHVSDELPENMTWREAERNLIVGWFLGLMTVIYVSIYYTHKAFFSSENVKAAQKAAKTNGEVLLIVLAVIAAIVIFFGAAALMLKLIEKKRLKNEFYAVFFGLAVSYIAINFTSIVGWLFST